MKKTLFLNLSIIYYYLMINYFFPWEIFCRCSDVFAVPFSNDQLIIAPQVINGRYQKVHETSERDNCNDEECGNDM